MVNRELLIGTVLVNKDFVAVRVLVNKILLTKTFLSISISFLLKFIFIVSHCFLVTS